MRSILVHADHDCANEVRLQTALELARRHRAHISLLIATPFQQFVAVDPFGGSYFVGEAMDKALADDAALEAALSARLRSEDVPWDVALADGEVVGSLAAAATFADLTIVSLPGNGQMRSDPAMLSGDLALATPAPVLALPRDISRLDFEAPVMIAWNGSPEAAWALRGAIPLLGGRRVELVMIGADDDGSLPATDALAYLSRHDIHAEARIVARDGVTAEEALERTALDMGAGLIVMGAFGKSRLRETLFGGATRYLITSGRLPLLLAH